MSDFDKLLTLTGSQEVSEGIELPKIQLHKWLVLGQTDYLCEYGTLSDGHEKFTDAQKYSQALKEQYYIALNIATQKAVGMEAQATILEARDELAIADTEAKKLRAMAKEEKGKAQLLSALTLVEDQTRMLRFYRNKAAQLKASVESKYPLGIEQAELDNWLAVAEYRKVAEETPGMQKQMMHNVPLPPVVKANLGISWGRPDMQAPLLIAEQENIEELAGGSLKAYVAGKTKELKLMENK